MTIPFGKFRGAEVQEVPFGYLGWLLEQDWLHQDLRDAICDELAARLKRMRRSKGTDDVMKDFRRRF